ncbi:hypothetical protein BJ138DRAFT_1163864 [Hygrophoropsis aurantiaca]|uniref:Uncharacterized protein n=1 Tax=Hygrophoropsis aurantiaca TaxID=72124 RepID=A0ACB7ZXM3_9AGAM|nr:hypothetical protein BJ138DRAFT_1163864 [Hygrophoropsis aurantiaca]
MHTSCIWASGAGVILVFLATGECSRIMALTLTSLRCVPPRLDRHINSTLHPLPHHRNLHSEKTTPTGRRRISSASRSSRCASAGTTSLLRQRKSAPWSTSRTARALRGCACFTIWCRIYGSSPSKRAAAVCMAKVRSRCVGVALL